MRGAILAIGVATIGAVILVSFAPVFLYAQSLEWLAEHPGSTTPAVGSSTPVTSTTSAAAATSTPLAVNTNEGIETKVRAQFADMPVMIDIARCESRFRQFDSRGNALDGGAGSMIGVFQINAPVHASFAKSLGMDIYTTDGNLAYSRYLYDKSGTDPWVSSLSCWSPLVPGEVGIVDAPSLLVSNLSFGMVHGDVLLLQKILNKSGFRVASDGAGSPGQETTKFGSLTRAAVRNFQCKNGIACEGNEYSTGYGFVGPRTRKALLAIATSEEASVVVQFSIPADPTIIPPPPASSPTPAQFIGNQAEIARLEAQIAELVARINALRQRN